jgi:hypothetical protein
VSSFFSNIHDEEVQQYIRIETEEGVSQLDQPFLTVTGKVLIYGQERKQFVFFSCDNASAVSETCKRAL